MERGAYRGRGRNSYGGGRGSYGGDRDGNGDHNSYGGGRGGYGGGRSMAVRKCYLRVNHFPVSFNPQSIIMHYNVEVKAKAPPPKNNRPPKKISNVVPLPEETFTVDVSKGEDERPVSYLVPLTLDLVVKENPLKQCVSLRRCFFPMNPPLRKKDLNHGIMAIGGFQQSLSLLLRDCPCAWTIRFCPFGRSCRRQVEHVLIGLKVNVKHRKTKQKYTITRLTPKVTRHITFPILGPEGRNPPKGSYSGNKTNFVPMELCELVEGQRYPKENLDKYAAKDLKGMSVAPPRVRQSTIQAMVNSEDGPCG
ncbi:hypothetical protein JHK84_054882 [Glycine max]|nr:hypothetical protein JHK86_054859 [Glycine max]KAG4917540.1 hypothetical protein JHK85_055821 [Glycine max]KAG5073651.1 hypothetical protein JHK84_054882 [Glycine max]